MPNTHSVRDRSDRTLNAFFYRIHIYLFEIATFHAIYIRAL